MLYFPTTSDPSVWDLSVSGGALMANKKYAVELSVDERAHLCGLIKKGKSSAQANLKARILLKPDQGDAGERWLGKDICAALHTNMAMPLGDCMQPPVVNSWSSA